VDTDGDDDDDEGYGGLGENVLLMDAQVIIIV